MRNYQVLLLATVLFLLNSAAAQARISHGYSGIFSLDTVTAVDDQDILPRSTMLTVIYPNPFNPRVTIGYELAEAGSVELAIFDLRGRSIQVVESGSRPVGRHQVTWDGRDDEERAVPAGTYFCRLRTPHKSQTKKLTLVR
jgi:hypothetical protein